MRAIQNDETAKDTSLADFTRFEKCKFVDGFFFL